MFSYLLQGKVSHANACLEAYLKARKEPVQVLDDDNNKIKLYDGAPLLNFLQMLLLSARVTNDASAGKLFLDLYNRYQSVFPVEERNLVDTVAQKVFKLKMKSSNASSNPLQAILQGMLN